MIIKKIKLIMLFSLFFIILCATGCDRGCNNGNQENSIPPLQIDGVQIIKFNEAEYKDYILTCFSTREDCALRMVSSKFFLPPSVLNLYGQSPYIQLADDYLLIDWKWRNVYWEDNEAVINKKWTELKDRSICFPIEDLYVSYPVNEHYFIAFDKIKEYNSGYLEHTITTYVDDFYAEENWLCLSKQTKTNVLDWTEETNKAYIECAEILNRMIQDGKLGEYDITPAPADL
jgi:hypothetical protein